ncbi:expressed unknown protein [Seminavis robusta]|uniref:Uncharacterized protein n=1 Tax=Seminavis robusta TaxID=568900 RepID=A0A9N8DMF0_9STRA|nr:expressed unknown protein [Seminavis robusta]|eukprot:Sro227_g092280.1 n/a (435) ;mRNA; r:37858-39162
MSSSNPQPKKRLVKMEFDNCHDSKKLRLDDTGTPTVRRVSTSDAFSMIPRSVALSSSKARHQNVEPPAMVPSNPSTSLQFKDTTLADLNKVALQEHQLGDDKNPPTFVEQASNADPPVIMSPSSRHHQTSSRAALLCQQLSNKREELLADEGDYWAARDRQVTVDQTVSSLTFKRQELKRELGIIRDELNMSKEEQQKAASTTEACLAKQNQTQQEFDELLAQLYGTVGADISESNGNTNIIHRDNRSSFVEMNPGSIPRKASHKRPNPVASSSPISDECSDDDSAAPSGFAYPARSSGGANDETVAKKQKKNKKRKIIMTQERAFYLVNAAANDEVKAKAVLSEWVSKAPLAEFREVFKLTSQIYAQSVTYCTLQKILRVFYYGNFHQREEFRLRISSDQNLKNWLLNSKGRVPITTFRDDMYKRLIAMLEIP